MSEEIEKKVSELLNEEKWTRATLNSYTINNFIDLDELIQNAVDQDVKNRIKDVCDEHLVHTKNSIIALYISGIIALNRQVIDDSNMIQLINIFSDNHKWNVVEFLCNRILSFGENKFALHTLASCYDHENEEEKKHAIWERLIKVDHDEADIVRFLAEIKEKEGDIDTAVEYYKRAIHRYINKKLFSNEKDMWLKLVEYIPEETDFFFQIERKVSRVHSPERATQLLEAYYAKLKSLENWDKSIFVLKRILSYDPKNVVARKEITECFKNKYSGHSHLDEYIRLSNLNQSWRNVHEAIGDFEKHISFDNGNFVWHRSWGIGRIREIKGNSIIIDFARKRNHEMSLKMAVSALTSLEKDHIWVLKSIWPKDKLKEKIKKDIPWALKIVIKSLNNSANMKQIKAELVPSILTAGEWSSWSVEARKNLKEDPTFGNLPDQVDQFVIRDTPITLEEKSFNRFKAEKTFFGRLSIFKDFLEISDPESEYFSELFNYFTGFLKSYSAVNEFVMASFLLTGHVVRKYPFLDPKFDITFDELFEGIEDIETLFSKLEDSDLRKELLIHIEETTEQWPEYFSKLFPYYLNQYIIDELVENGKQEVLKSLYHDIIEKYKDKREAVIWLARNTDEEAWNNEFEIPFEKVLISLIKLLEISFREINNRRDVSFNRKINKQVQTILFKEKVLLTFVETSEEDSVNRIFSLINDIKDLDPSLKLDLKSKIMEKFPKFKFFGGEEKETVSRGLIVTRESYEEKQRQLKHILEVEIPLNSKEIGEAIELGDLKENAEYKAGKEKQELLNITVGKLKEDLEKATIFKANEIDTSRISFGTKVTLLNMNSEKEEVYSFMGPWESDPAENIISYLSPFGNKLWNHKAGETVSFTINERDYTYRIDKIEALDF